MMLAVIIEKKFLGIRFYKALTFTMLCPIRIYKIYYGFNKFKLKKRIQMIEWYDVDFYKTESDFYYQIVQEFKTRKYDVPKIWRKYDVEK